MSKDTGITDAYAPVPYEWAFGPNKNEPLGRKAAHRSDGNIKSHMLGRLETVANLNDSLVATMMDAKRNGLLRASAYLGFRLVHIVRIATSALSLIGSVALTVLTLPLYQTIANRYFRICLLNSLEHLKDCAKKLPIVFEIQWARA